MNEQETKAILALCSEIWANVSSPNAARLAIWQEMLADLPFELVKRAIKQLAYASASPFIPPISEIRRTVAEMTGPVYPTPAEAYGQIHQAVNRADWDETEIKEHVHPLVWRVYQWIGAYDYRMASSDIIRAQFMRMYQAELTRALEHDRIPEAFHRQTEALRG
ncbi:MAG: replicative helicase loader/inhibitor [Coprothermobacterota bacterium]|nr:replicative helicase loader/inhibitor [Coprothermobacterota bacterium]